MSHHTYRVVKKLYGFNHPVCMLNKNNVLDSFVLLNIWWSVMPWAFWHLFQQDRVKNKDDNARKTIFQGGGSEGSQKFHILIKFDHLMDF